ncbi:hypothetical protein HGA88_00140 [Candidatus Roizmanbacteria bacterium]|nr:hypothetical protein [Candidatus Roizmanbacteria bacterium]
MDLLLYSVLSFTYILIVHFGIGLKKDLELYLFTSFFVLCGVLGYFIHSYETGLVVAIILTLVFW